MREKGQTLLRTGKIDLFIDTQFEKASNIIQHEALIYVNECNQVKHEWDYIYNLDWSISSKIIAELFYPAINKNGIFT